MKNYNFMEKRKTAFIIAAVVLVLGVVSMIIRGFNLDIDFAGGSEFSITIGKTVSADEIKVIKDIVKEVTGKDASSVAKSGSDANQAIIKTKELSNEMTDKLFSALKEKYSLTAETFDSIQTVGSTISGDTQKTAIVSCLVAVALILVYITIRFQFTSGLSSIACLAFNIFTMIAFYSLLQIPVNSNLIAACLTILGYSINATIVVFDRVRENNNKFKLASFDENANLAIKQTLARSVNTTITTLLTIGMVYILGVDSIKNFALPIIIGIIAGVFSSVFLGAPLWSIFNGIFSKEAKNSKKSSKENELNA